MEEKIHTDEYGEKTFVVYDDTGKELYQKYPSGGDEDVIVESVYHKNQLVSKVTYFAYGISVFGTESLDGTFYKEFTFGGKQEGYWLRELHRENYVNGKKVYEYYDGDEEWFDYDSNGNLIHSTDSDGNKKIYEYDSYGNLTRIKKQAGSK